MNPGPLPIPRRRFACSSSTMSRQSATPTARSWAKPPRAPGRRPCRICAPASSRAPLTPLRRRRQRRARPRSNSSPAPAPRPPSRPCSPRGTRTGPSPSSSSTCACRPGPTASGPPRGSDALDPDVEIVVCTAYSDVDPASIAARVPPEDKLFYLQKPFHPHEVRQMAIALGQKWAQSDASTGSPTSMALTGLPNRTYFQRATVGGDRDCREQAGSSSAVLYLDLDNFKRINDTLGHGVGDELLCTMAERLRRTAAARRPRRPAQRCPSRRRT